MGTVSDETSWILEFLRPNFSKIENHINEDPEFRAVVSEATISIGLVSSDNTNYGPGTVLIRISNKKISLSSALDAGTATFSLQARPEDWQSFFETNSALVRPYQSFWGMLRVLAPDHLEICIHDDNSAFGKYARLWRILLDRIRDALHDKSVRMLEVELPEDEMTDDDAVTGRYMWLSTKAYGKVKIFYESSGTGQQDILFLHTAGSDSRQYHSLMNDKELGSLCTMYAFDLPAHGRSSLGTSQLPEEYKLTEESYVEVIGLVLQKLQLKNVIVCGASMAGHVCLAVAIRARELGVRGVVPCEGCEHLSTTQPIYEVSGSDISVLDPERVCGMIAPTSPEYYKRQIWWQYSSQGYNIFKGDLRFYFKGWDGRGRIESIDTKFCPVYMLTGEYDYSCTVEASAATAAKIPGAVFEPMKGLGHFPLTENPKRALPHLIKAIRFIQNSRS